MALNSFKVIKPESVSYVKTLKKKKKTNYYCACVGDTRYLSVAYDTGVRFVVP